MKDRKITKFSFIGELPNFHVKLYNENYHTPSGAYFSTNQDFDPVSDEDFIKHNGKFTPLRYQIGYAAIDENPNGYNQYAVTNCTKLLTDETLSNQRKIGFSRMGEEPNYIDVSYLGGGIFQTMQYLSRPQHAIPEWLLNRINIHSVHEE